MNSDSRIDTYEHITQVRRFLNICISELQSRQLEHDRTKLSSPEKEAYDGLGERLRKYEYGSEGYRAVLREMKPAIKHHYEANSHHPEHYADGIRGMNLLDVIEMLCDWKAASLRQGTQGSILDSLDHNQERFGFSDDLKSILRNTIPLIEGDHSARKDSV